MSSKNKKLIEDEYEEDEDFDETEQDGDEELDDEELDDEELDDEEEEEEEEYNEEEDDEEEEDENDEEIIDEQDDEDEDEENEDDYEYGGDDDEIVDGEDIVFDDPDDIDIHEEAVRVNDNERVTLPTMTKYEIARVIGIRTKQLSEGARPLISNINNKTPIRIAIDELLLNRTPFKIKRPMPYPAYEIWKISELKVNISQDDIDDLILAIK
jgi:DNA-directed RNA polymerase subunit K/omega